MTALILLVVAIPTAALFAAASTPGLKPLWRVGALAVLLVGVGGVIAWVPTDRRSTWMAGYALGIVLGAVSLYVQRARAKRADSA